MGGEIPATRRPRHAELATDVHWIELQIRTLYQHDERGRITCNRDPSAAPAPAFHLSRSAHGNLWRFSSELEPGLVRELSRLAGREAPLPVPDLLEVATRGGVPSPPQRWEAMRRLLGAPVRSLEPEWLGPAFRFPEATHGADNALPRELERRPLTQGDADRLTASPFAWLVAELAASQPSIAVFDGESVVAAVWSARGGVAGDARACEAGIEVLASHRGRGIGRGLVAEWAARVCLMGSIPLYSTSWSNRASRALALSLDLIPYAENAHLGRAAPQTRLN